MIIGIPKGDSRMNKRENICLRSIFEENNPFANQ